MRTHSGVAPPVRRPLFARAAAGERSSRPLRAALTGAGVLLVTAFAMTLGGSPPAAVDPPGADGELAAEVDAPVVSVIVVASTAPPLVPSATDAAAPSSSVAAAAAAPPGCAQGYTVQPGDYWIGIADRTNMPLDVLLAVNGAAESTPLYPGGTICLPPAAT